MRARGFAPASLLVSALLAGAAAEGVQAAATSTPQAFAAYVASELARWKTVLADLGVQSP